MSLCLNSNIFRYLEFRNSTIHLCDRYFIICSEVVNVLYSDVRTIRKARTIDQNSRNCRSEGIINLRQV